MATIVDQREVQRRSGICSKYPISCVVADILRSVRHDVVVDVTYGQGRFYVKLRPRILIGCDPFIYEWVVTPDIFIKKPVWSLEPILRRLGLEYDVLVVDPPWGDNSYNRRPQFKRVLGSHRIIVEKAFELAEKLEIPFILLHYPFVYEREMAKNPGCFLHLCFTLPQQPIPTQHLLYII